MNDSFVFYKSFLEMAEFITDAEQKLALYEGIIQYAIRGIEPQFEESHTLAKMAFAGIKPQIDANNKRKADGKKGGRPAGKTEKKPVVIKNENHRLKNEKPNVNVNVNDNIKEKNKKENGDKSLFDFSLNLSFGNSEAFLDAWKRWETYRREKKLAKWTESTLVAKAKVFEQWGESKTIQSIEQSIANGWQGLFEPKEHTLKEPKKSKREEIYENIKGNDKLFKALFNAKEGHSTRIHGDYPSDPKTFDDWNWNDVVLDEIEKISYSESRKIYNKYIK